MTDDNNCECGHGTRQHYHLVEKDRSYCNFCDCRVWTQP